MTTRELTQGRKQRFVLSRSNRQRLCVEKRRPLPKWSLAEWESFLASRRQIASRLPAAFALTETAALEDSTGNQGVAKESS